MTLLGTSSLTMGGSSGNTITSSGSTTVVVNGMSANTLSLTGTNLITIAASSTNTFNVTGSGSTTAFTVGVGGQVSVNVSAVFTGNSNGVSVLNLTGDGSGNTFVVSSLGGFPGVVTLNDTNRNQGPPPPVDTITLLAGVGANVNTYPDGNGGTDMRDGFGILDIVGSQPQDSTTIQDDTDVEEGGWRDSIYDTIVIPEAPMPGDPSSMSVEATAIPGYSGLNQTGDWTFLTEIGTPFYYADGSSFGLAQGFIYEGDGTATLSNGEHLPIQRLAPFTITT